MIGIFFALGDYSFCPNLTPHPRIGFALKNTYSLVYNTNIYLKKVADIEYSWWTFPDAWRTIQTPMTMFVNGFQCTNRFVFKDSYKFIQKHSSLSFKLRKIDLASIRKTCWLLRMFLTTEIEVMNPNWF